MERAQGRLAPPALAPCIMGGDETGRPCGHILCIAYAGPVSVCSSAAALNVSSTSRRSPNEATLLMQGESAMENTEDAALRSQHLGDGSETIPHSLFVPSANG